MDDQLENGIIYALMAGVFWGMTPLLLKKGMTRSNVSAATLVQQGVIVMTLIIIGLGRGEIVRLDIPAKALWSFVAAGLLGASVGKIFYNKGIDKVGVSKSVSIKNSDPIVAVFFLVLILGEELTYSIAVGVGLIVSGIFVLTRIDKVAEQNPNRPLNYFYPFLALLCYGVTPVFKKIGMVGTDLPAVGALIAQFTALIGILTVGRILDIKPKREKIPTKSLVYFVMAGITEALGSLFTFHSLIYAPAVVVSPIWRISPLVAFVLARFALRGEEVVTLKDGIAAALIVFGILVLHQG